MERLAQDKARQKVYKVLRMYLTCIDTYFSMEIRPKPNKNGNNCEVIQKFITTTRQLQNVIQSLEEI